LCGKTSPTLAGRHKISKFIGYLNYRNGLAYLERENVIKVQKFNGIFVQPKFKDLLALKVSLVKSLKGRIKAENLSIAKFKDLLT